MNEEKEAIIAKLLDIEIIDEKHATTDVIDYYSKTIEIIERTNLARSKKTPFIVKNASTITEKLNTSVFASTH